NKWTEYTLSNEAGICIKFLNYGGIITQLITPNQDGALENIVLGYKDYRDYEENPNYFGAIIGRVAGRIKVGVLPLDGKEYHIDKNEGENHLHGGLNGFHQVIWDTEPFEEENEIGVRLSYSSPDGESGYPGKVDVTVTYS